MRTIINEETICQSLAISWESWHQFIDEGNTKMALHCRDAIMTQIDGMMSLITWTVKSKDDRQAINDDLYTLWQVAFNTKCY